MTNATVPVATGLLPDGGRRPALWLLAAHGGAGVSTLEAFWGFAADADRQWPAGADPHRESPFVVVVARATTEGLTSAHELLLAHRREQLACRLLGLVTVAASPGAPAKPVRQRLDLTSAAAPAVWSIKWNRHLNTASRALLPRWDPRSGVPDPAETDIPADVLGVGVELVNTIAAQAPAVLA